MPGQGNGPSPALLAANRRLHQLRAEKGIGRAGSGQAESGCEGGLSHQGEKPAEAASPKRSTGGYLAKRLPEHLGWESGAVTRALRQALARQETASREAEPLAPEEWALEATTPPAAARPQKEEEVVTLHPALALAMLRQKQAAAGRVWYLLRYLDRGGRGWLPAEEVTRELTDKKAHWRICGPRQLRNLLRQGQGVFWERDKERIWLKSAAKVALALGVKRLSGRPVAMPVAALAGGMGQVRAHFYAAFHSGRAPQDQGRPGRPVSRATLAKLSGVPARSQRHYEKIATVRAQANIAVGPVYTEETFRKQAWRHGRATFRFTDYQGRLGAPGRAYVAWRLPNSYHGPHEQCPRGRKKKINQQIDLVNGWAQGNDRPGRLFHPNGGQAGRAFNRDSERDRYWPDSRRRSGRPQIWQALPARDE